MTTTTYICCRIHTNSYSGNWQREIAEFVMGVSSEYGPGKYNHLAEEDMSDEQFKWLDNNVRLVDGEHGGEIATMIPTPGWSNDGNGGHYPNEDHPYPAYNSVEIVFTEAPPEDIRNLIRERVELFTQFKGEQPWEDFTSIKVSEIEFLKVETEEHTQEI